MTQQFLGAVLKEYRMSSKKNLIAIAISAVAMGSVFAQNTVNSQVSGAAVSYSVANGNSYSTHAASAMANNSSASNGTQSMPGMFGPYYQASANGNTATMGSTTTTASGLGVGTSTAGASQAGTATSGHAANAIKPSGSFYGVPYGNGGTVGNVLTSSNALVGTQSTVGVVNTGLAMSGTSANAHNVTSAHIAAPTAGTTGAVGSSTGAATATAFHFNTPGDSSSANGTMSGGGLVNVGAFQNGAFNGTITRP